LFQNSVFIALIFSNESGFWFDVGIERYGLIDILLLLVERRTNINYILNIVKYLIGGAIMAIRKIVQIDENKCDGCGLCIPNCAEGALKIINGKAKLVSEVYCDGLGACLGHCPQDAISVIEREAEEFDEKAVEEFLASEKQSNENEMTFEHNHGQGCQSGHHHGHGHSHQVGCPGSMMKQFNNIVKEDKEVKVSSKLRQWPVQLTLVPPNAPYFNGANLLVAADCTAYAYGDFHNKFIKNKVTLIGCPKLDEGNYAEKLTEIIRNNDIKSVTVVRMEVPCCGGIEFAVKTALQNIGKFIPWQVVTISTDGNILE
jgi:ferredoxin